ncbi:hypothetical protein SASPL_141560 [Salvia splendens]|uniref:hAT-like transposase RNase-H fold domain-containing protein n=1 Tax=Salvia splendens TaxID=180675 RepID=A0A8X8WS61_SALSN|nr:hypothetical protein SASPL_141560 [Salvia splendens]
MKQGSRIVPHSFSQKRCELKMAQYVIRDEVCFRAVEKEGFVALVNEFEPRFQMPSRRRVAVQKIGIMQKHLYTSSKVSMKLSASKTPTSHLIALSMFALQIEIEKKCGDSDFTLSKDAKTMKLKFEKYWEDWSKMNPLIFISNVLDPRNKLQMLKVSVKKLKVRSLTNVDQDQQLQHLCDRFKNDLVSLWGEYKGVNDTVLNQRPLLECEDVGDNIGQGGLYLFDELYNGVQEEIEQDQLNQISNEVDKYLADEMEKSDWLRAENFSLYKDPIDEYLEFYREIEEIEKNQNMGQDASQVTPLLELILCLSQFTSTRIAIHNPLPNPL